MAEYIEHSKVVDALVDKTSIEGCELEEAVNAICYIPAADVRPVVRGKWELQEDLLTWEGTFDGYFCSKCGKGYLNDLCCGNGEHYVDVTKEFNFCPNCGCAMEES